MDVDSPTNNQSQSPTSGQAKDLNKINFNSKLEATADVRIVLPGDYIGEGFIAGHGTYESPKDHKIYANLAGVVH